jgi:prepilin-type processing-associated H-X9-DG protein
MNDNLVGYLLNALEPDAQREVEAALKDNPETQQRLETLRQALEPLAADRAEIEPPAGLVVRTLGRVAEHCCRDLPRAPVETAAHRPAASRPFWRRADVLVAAALLLTVLGGGISWLSRAHAQRYVAECQNNLRVFYTALKAYADNHGNRLPSVAEVEPPRNVAGMVVPILMEAGTLPRDANVGCPGNTKPRTCALTLADLQGLDPESFKRRAQELSCCYGYSLGYQDETGYHGPRIDPGLPHGQLPIMADCPPRDPTNGNSVNHGRRGQNVLFLDGHVRFCGSRDVGVDHDDIYLNRAGRQAAGLDVMDTVLGSSAASP